MGAHSLIARQPEHSAMTFLGPCNGYLRCGMRKLVLEQRQRATVPQPLLVLRVSTRLANSKFDSLTSDWPENTLQNCFSLPLLLRLLLQLHAPSLKAKSGGSHLRTNYSPKLLSSVLTQRVKRERHHASQARYLPGPILAMPEGRQVIQGAL